MTTARDWIYRAMRRCGVLGPNESLDPEDSDTALSALNDMLASWSVQPHAIYGLYSDGFTCTPNVAVYSSTLLALGRPVDIKAGKVTLSQVDYVLDIKTDSTTYNAISYKPAPGIPELCWYNATYPDSAFTFWPTPYAAFAATFQCWGLLGGGVLTLNSTVQVPPGYERAIVLGLGVELAGDFGKSVDADFKDRAADALAWVKRQNRRPRPVPSLGLDHVGANRGLYNIYGDTIT